MLSLVMVFHVCLFFIGNQLHCWNFRLTTFNKHMNVYVYNQRTKFEELPGGALVTHDTSFIHTQSSFFSLGPQSWRGLELFLSQLQYGLTYISTTRRLIRVLWVCIVIAGFTGAGVLIYQSFDTWAESRNTISLIFDEWMLDNSN